MIFKNTTSKVTLCTSFMLLLSACSLTEQPKPVVKVQEENVCMNQKGQIIDCPKNVERFTGTDDMNSATVKNSNNNAVSVNNINRAPSNNANSSMMVASQDAMLNSHSLTGSQHSVLLSEYIEQISAGLIANVTNEAEHVIVGVTSFVDFTSDLATITPVGNIVSEHFTTHLFQHGFTVADYKVKNTVSITPQGDFVFTRDANKLMSSESITHVLTGTVMYQQTGLLINARVVDFENKWIISTASGFIPYFVLDTIIPNGAKHTVL